MAFWLAHERRGQASGTLHRFDPRFWTIDFPRPMMASVVATGPESLRVDCEFWHPGELAGLIWASEDTLDHPLLGYETRRDYAECTLRFRWRSGGIVPLDAINGPTLTIEGRDAAGVPRAWYVRLWNYAVGTPEDAAITLSFSDLQAGWSLPGDPVPVHAIDRLFISLVPPDYDAGNTAPYAERKLGWAEVSAIRCEGAGASLAIGEAFLPVHGDSMATAYDDCCNQTPQRLVRMITQLGYRGRVCHYLGMSHYYRLRNVAGALLADRGGAFCEPMKRWHAAYFEALRDDGLSPIASLSYELFAANCPDDLQQRFHDASPARTGWSPPSALLSPANADVDAFLCGVAGEAVQLLRDAGCAVLVQIGEPWWWTDPTTRAPALYDDAARALLDSGTAPIADLRAPLEEAQTALLDRAGAALAASTARIAAHVRMLAPEGCEVLLLVFTPTVLDPETPESRRMNLPPAWAYPAFDRIQLEDYDWVIAGREADSRRAWAAVDAALGYPLERQDYLAGFVLRAEDAATHWPGIDWALGEARRRGVPHRFVWALPQVARDGFTRLTFEESPMIAFDDVPYPLALGRDASASPEFSTSIAVTASGHEHRNALWANARMRYDVGPGVRSEADLGMLLAFFRARLGPARGFRLRDPFDYSSHGMTGVPGPLDQLLGSGDGQTARFRLVKHYGDQTRQITRPDPDSILVAVDATPAPDVTLEEGGWIVFAAAPPVGAAVTAGFLFDVPVRFAEDRIEVSGLSLGAGEAPSVPLVEIREGA